jgi:hypothetical protein
MMMAWNYPLKKVTEEDGGEQDGKDLAGVEEETGFGGKSKKYFLFQG